MQAPIGNPIQLKAHDGSFLEVQLGWQKPFGNSKKTFPAWNQFILKRTVEDRVKIKSRWNLSVLTVQEDGSCLFAEDQGKPNQEFVIETGDNAFFFVSYCFGRTLQCTPEGQVKCDNFNRLDWEKWQLVVPESEDIITVPALKGAAYSIVGMLIDTASKFLYP
ncbi:hypothetical protein BVRB_026050 [Beta vulgaris subsp. vulgaris]|uniref:Fascin domain-containing protein n=1 Tax=Beta vulgaris subsp. vulgaris TaxID=3555 RepID=A0A0J8DT80_BETVV|nr:hypothetical protein BVRB_026050 [Beta vulgaris subsp. vulgaris]